MKRLGIFALAVIIGLSFSAGAMAKEAKKPTIKKENVTTVKAKVQAVDLNTRAVTLKDTKGKVFDLKVGEEAKNLPQVQVGDEVVAKYYESLAVEVRKP